MAEVKENKGLVDISGLPKLALLRMLWDNRRPARFFEVHPEVRTPGWDPVLAGKMIPRGYIDYFQGRCIKTNLNKDCVDATLYNRDVDVSKGDKGFEQIVAELRAAVREEEERKLACDNRK